jgi:hypothetical protein
MKRVEVDLLGDAVNAVVLRVPGRRFPGIVIQGDSLSILQSTVERLVAALADARLSDATDEAVELRELLKGYKHAYEEAMTAAGLALPY